MLFPIQLKTLIMSLAHSLTVSDKTSTKQMIELLLISLFVFKPISSQKCASQQRSKALKELIYCGPMPQIVALELPPDLESVVPKHIKANRCQGSCISTSHECLPLEIQFINQIVTGR